MMISRFWMKGVRKLPGFGVLFGGVCVVVGIGSCFLNVPVRAYSQQDGGMKMSQQDGAEGGGGEFKFTNRLIHETSPYLLQHAHNPVDWYPWGEEAFEAAREQQKPIFVSIGYSTCYWCHVMERESFEDEETAALMNRDFICIKVDREERPDVDDIYMKAEQLLNNGSGGWPMSVFLVPPPPEGLRPDKAWEGLQPFWAGTYFPKVGRGRMPSFKDVLRGIRKGWDEQHDDVIQQASAVADAVKKELSTEHEPVVVGDSDFREAVTNLLRIADRKDGGFGRAPKFPQPVFLEILMSGREGDSVDPAKKSDIDTVVRLTLDRMAMGGMFDQVGGGFHRYSTDGKWLVPHFEKMLYGNGLLAGLYARAGDLYDDDFYRDIAARTCEYVLREMVDPETGGFYSAQDAEVDGHEGADYLWTRMEVKKTLAGAGFDDDVVSFALDVYGLNGGTNFKDPHHGEDEPKNILFLSKRPDDIATDYDLTPDEVRDRLQKIDAVLLHTRDQRKQSRTDDKVITGWNGLMIAGLAETGKRLDRSDFVDAAARAWRYIDENMRDGEGNLLRSSRHGVINKKSAFAEDYGMLAMGLIALYRADHDEDYLKGARDLIDRAERLFGDEKQGGFFDTLAGQGDLFVRSRSSYDGAIPCANSVLMHDLIDLYQLTGDEKYVDEAAGTMRSLSSEVHRNPLGASNTTLALRRLIGIAPKLVAGIGAADGDQPVKKVENAAVDDKVDIHVSPAVISLGDHQEVAVNVEIKVADGFHMNAHDPGDPDLRGLEVRIAGGSGVSATVEYPESESFTLGGSAINVYTGVVKLVVTVKRDGAVGGEPVLIMSYQVCNDEVCLRPRDVVLPVEIGVE